MVPTMKISSPSKPVFQQDPHTFSKSQKISHQKLLFLHWWFLIGYYGLCVPFKPVCGPTGAFQLETKKFQRVNVESVLLA